MLLFNNNLNLANVNFHKPIYNKINDLFFVKLTNNEHKDCLIQTPKFKIYGIQDCILELEFVPECNQFYQDLRKFDNFIINNISTNGDHLFGVKLDKNSVRDLYKLSPKIPKIIPRLPIIIVVIENGCQLLDQNEKQIQLDELKVNQYINFHLNIDGVYFEKSKFYAIYKTNKIQLINEMIKDPLPNKLSLSNYSTSPQNSHHSHHSVSSNNSPQNNKESLQSKSDIENFQYEQKLHENDNNLSDKKKLIDEHKILYNEIEDMTFSGIKD